MVVQWRTTGTKYCSEMNEMLILRFYTKFPHIIMVPCFLHPKHCWLMSLDTNGHINTKNIKKKRFIKGSLHKYIKASAITEPRKALNKTRKMVGYSIDPWSNDWRSIIFCFMWVYGIYLLNCTFSLSTLQVTQDLKWITASMFTELWPPAGKVLLTLTRPPWSGSVDLSSAIFF